MIHIISPLPDDNFPVLQPSENKLTDYWSIFDFVNKGYLSSLDNFKANYVFRIERLEEEVKMRGARVIESFTISTKNKSAEKLISDTEAIIEMKDLKMYTR